MAEKSTIELHKLKSIQGIKQANGKIVGQSNVNTLSNNNKIMLEKSTWAVNAIFCKKKNHSFPCNMWVCPHELECEFPWGEVVLLPRECLCHTCSGACYPR